MHASQQKSTTVRTDQGFHSHTKYMQMYNIFQFYLHALDTIQLNLLCILKIVIQALTKSKLQQKSFGIKLFFLSEKYSVKTPAMPYFVQSGVVQIYSATFKSL